jgi:Ran GTPase-activating protein (RanGAP) involved in mRNA processing and transport
MEANQSECVGLLDLPDELLADTVAHLPGDDECAAALACARLRKAVASSARPRTSIARTSTSIGSVFRSLAKLQWAFSCGLPIDSELARKAKDGPREHLLLLLDTLPRLPLIGLGIHLTELDLCDKQIGDTGAVGLAKALEVNKTLTKLNLYNNQIGDAGAIGLGRVIEVNETLTRLDFDSNQVGDAGAIGLGKALEVNATLTKLDLIHNHIGDAGAIGLGKALEVNATLTKLYLDHNHISDAGAISFCKSLEVNETLTNINLLHNAFSTEAAAELVQATKSNGCQLKSLCGIEAGTASADFLTRCLRGSDAILLAYDLEVNATLTNLFLQGNYFCRASTVAIWTAWQSKPSRDRSLWISVAHQMRRYPGPDTAGTRP